MCVCVCVWGGGGGVFALRVYYMCPGAHLYKIQILKVSERIYCNSPTINRAIVSLTFNNPFFP